MTATDRIASERAFHDAQAAARAASFAAGRADLRFDDNAYLDHEPWVRPAVEALGDVSGLDVLDYGCGHGMAAALFARRGAHVSAFDLSAGYVAEASRRAAANGVEVECRIADAESLPYPDESFDAVWGSAILHHLYLPTAARELRRILRPGGRAVFCEPWGGNPMLAYARRRLAYPGKHRTPEECPLTPNGVAHLRDEFPGLTVRGFQLLGMVKRAAPRLPGVKRLEALDRRLLAAVPALESWCRYVVITLTVG